MNKKKNHLLSFFWICFLVPVLALKDPFNFSNRLRIQHHRLRGGPKPGVGFLQVEKEDRWNTLCLEGDFGVKEANVLCREIGYGEAVHVGKGLDTAPFNASREFKSSITYTNSRSIRCDGSEDQLSHCSRIPSSASKECRGSPVSIACTTPSLTKCDGNTTFAFRERCYRVFYQESTFEESVATCRSSIRGGELVELNDWEEHNFVMELLNPTFITTRIWTGGYLFRSEGKTDSPAFPFWFGSRNPIKDYPPLSFPSVGKELALSLDARVPPFASKDPWSFTDARKTYPFVCFSRSVDIGCLIDPEGADYEGTASRTESGSICLPWNSPGVPILFEGQESWDHNYCRNKGGEDDAPMCFVDDGVTDYCSIPLCKEKEALRFLGNEAIQCSPELPCGPEHFECQPGVCIFNRYVCDGTPDCYNESDEKNCMNYLDYFGKDIGFKLGSVAPESRFHNVSLNECARMCVQSKYCSCLSFAYKENKEECAIGTRVSSTYSYDAVLQDSNWDYYTLKKAVEETGCHRFKRPAGTPIEGIRLIKRSKLDIVEVRIQDTWGGICDDGFGQTEADVICRQLGFSGGSIKNEGGQGTRDQPILIYELKCAGNETSISECEFKNHASSRRTICTGDERIGLKCRKNTDSISSKEGIMFKCPIGEWKCISKNECVDISYLCDGVDDCSDGSDENEACSDDDEGPQALTGDEEPLRLRLSEESFGKLEILYDERWSTLCDSDFGLKEATIVCRMLGFDDGKYAKIYDEPVHVPMKGPLWISLGGKQRCTGSEYSLDQCKSRQFWVQSQECKSGHDTTISCMRDDGFENTRLDSALPPPPFESLSLLEEMKEKLSFSKCGSINVNESGIEMNARIVGGQNSIYGRHPWQASIRVQTRDSSFHWCGAVIIGKHYLLSAAHCLKEFPLSTYIIRVGDYVLEVEDKSEKEYDIEEVIFHENYNLGPYLNNDIALIVIKSKEGLKYSEHVSSVCLPSPYFVYGKLKHVTISGWGRTGTGFYGTTPKSHNDNKGLIPKTLQQADVPIIPKSRCKEEAIYGSSKLSVGMFCAGHLDGNKGDACQGDSGGPAVAEIDGKHTLLGVTSWGYGCGRKNKPGVYTKVSNYVFWIREQLEKRRS